MHRPLLVLAALFGLGALAVDEGVRPSEAVALIALAMLLIVLALLAPARAGGLAVAAAALALGASSAAVERLAAGAMPLLRLVEGGASGVPLRLVGVARGDLATLEGRTRVVLDVNRVERHGVETPCRGRASILIGGEVQPPPLRDGDRVALWASVRSSRERVPSSSRAPPLVLGYCKSARLVQRGPGHAGAPGRGAAAAVRAWMRAALLSALPPGAERGLVLAMVLGDRSGIDRETGEAFRASGTYHVLALSGAQVALVAALLAGLLRRAGAHPVGQAVLASAAVWFYAVLVGGDAPVARAAVMAVAVLLGRALQLDGEAANLLGLAALVLLAAKPSQATDVGFQLSFAATLGILLLARPLAAGLPRLPLRAELGVSASAAAQLALAPILAAHFHRLAPAALVLNLAAVPLSAAVLLLGVALALVHGMAPPLSAPLATAAWIAAHALRRSGDLGPLAPWLDVRVAAPTALVLGLHAAALLLIARRERARGLWLAGLAHALLVLGPVSPGDGRLHLRAIDVGQGDSLLLRSPSGRALLVDAGGSHDGQWDVGERVVGPELWRAGVRRLDALAVTHAHPDHAGGVPLVLRAFAAREVWEGLAAPLDPQWRRLDRALRAADVTRRCLVRGARLAWDGVEIETLAPVPPGRPPPRVRNEDSVVLLVRYGEVAMLLAGDTQGEAEETLRPPRAEVVKVPHHGSRSSSGSSFLAATRPRVAIVSAGARNPFGHPHPSVLSAYTRAGALLLRTDRDGTIEVMTDGRRIWVRGAAEAVERRVR